MFKKIMIVLNSLLMLNSSIALAQKSAIQLSEPVEIPVNGKPELYYASAADYNSDGNLDLIVGNFKGVLSVKLNFGTPSAPLFNPKINLKSNNKDIIIPHW